LVSGLFVGDDQVGEQRRAHVVTGPRQHAISVAGGQLVEGEHGVDRLVLQTDLRGAIDGAVLEDAALAAAGNDLDPG